MLRVLVIVIMLLLGLIGLGMSLCGGGVVIMAFSNPGWEDGLLVTIAGLSLLVGIFLVWGSVVILRRKLDRHDERSDT